MPRLPTKEEARAQAAERLDELWAYLKSPEEAATVFAELEIVIQAPLSVSCRLLFAQGAVTYCSRIQNALEVSAVKKAQRLVQRVRRDIEGLKRSRDHHERLLLDGKARSYEAGRECLAAYESAKEGLDELCKVAGEDKGCPPHERLAEAAHVTWEAYWKVQLPFRFADCETALGLLDDLLSGWGAITESSRGQNWESKSFNALIVCLEEVFEKATRTRAAVAASCFVPFVNRAVDALPKRFAKYCRHSEHALQKRIRRSLSKRPFANG